MENTEVTNTEVVESQEIKTESADLGKIREQLEKEVREKVEKDTQREIDRRVTEAIKKRESKLREEQEERERIARLSESERLKEIQEQKERELEARHREIVSKELKLTLVDILAEQQLPLEFRDIIDVSKYVGQKPEERDLNLKRDIELFKESFNSIIDKRTEEIKKEYLKGNTPQHTDTTVKPMSAYDKAKKNNDVRGMLGAKLFGEK